MARAGITLDKLVEAGAQLADETGFEHLTGAALARHFDVKLASLYSHIPSFDDLKSRIALFALKELADRATDALAGRTAKDALTALANVYRDYAREHPGRFAAARHPVSAERAAESAGGQLVRMTSAVLRSYATPEAEQAHAIRLLGGFFMGYVTLESAGGFAHSAPASDLSWSRSLDALDVMLRHWPAAT
ncbi:MULTISPECIES: TetR/AcrR family transcriptional regulator [Burkholderia]|uniref:TetR/AcrR family transcriptional regulator n=1 Tax=Burkholderia contaminans TaxID=488447 RepID=A0A2S5E824_9BURK|nr:MULTISPECIES: TetR-like C-terminal domain-containing protein [Burkholderia]EKS9793437.1 WHG domain-containing protein [Burkholderia cepacia]EKS9801317.1 WHG domain-containing protein [Burkholderia cepacia]EKS9808766.1 WHG domain-containing protein [Burkholderia cepacia]EKS9816740.1 WHG domain-containing protein [Burkholderia cepacia]EKS9824878.1 WHG domain-containing protein [Burkholderia cepacia]